MGSLLGSTNSDKGFLGDFPLFNILGSQDNGVEFINSNEMMQVKDPSTGVTMLVPPNAAQNKGFMDGLFGTVGQLFQTIPVPNPIEEKLGATVQAAPAVVAGVMNNPFGGLGTGQPGLFEGLWESKAPNTGLTALFEAWGIKGIMPQGTIATMRDAAPWAGWAAGNIFVPGIGGMVGRPAGEMAGQVVFGEEGNKKYWKQYHDNKGNLKPEYVPFYGSSYYFA